MKSAMLRIEIMIFLKLVKESLRKKTVKQRNNFRGYFLNFEKLTYLAGFQFARKLQK